MLGGSGVCKFEILNCIGRIGFLLVRFDILSNFFFRLRIKYNLVLVKFSCI